MRTLNKLDHLFNPTFVRMAIRFAAPTEEIAEITIKAFAKREKEGLASYFQAGGSWWIYHKQILTAMPKTWGVKRTKKEVDKINKEVK